MSPGYAVAHGGVPERPNGAVLKTAVPFAGHRGFKSHPRRFRGVALQDLVAAVVRHQRRLRKKNRARRDRETGGRGYSR